MDKNFQEVTFTFECQLLCCHRRTTRQWYNKHMKMWYELESEEENGETKESSKVGSHRLDWVRTGIRLDLFRFDFPSSLSLSSLLLLYLCSSSSWSHWLMSRKSILHLLRILVRFPIFVMCSSIFFLLNLKKNIIYCRGWKNENCIRM